MNVTITVTVPKSWIDYVTSGSDVFMQGACGYWARGVAVTKARGWLVYDCADEDRRPTEEEIWEAMAAWRKGLALPKNFHAFNATLAHLAFSEGVKAHGAGFWENGDANDYEVAIQRALFDGKVLYG